MTEKRFNYDYKTGRLCDNESLVQNTKNPLHWVTKLNVLDSECKELKKENEQLKIDLGIAEDNRKLDREIIDDLQEYVKKLEKENKELKKLLLKPNHHKPNHQ